MPPALTIVALIFGVPFTAQSVGFGSLTTMGLATVCTDALTAGIAQGSDNNPTATTRDIPNLF